MSDLDREALTEAITSVMVREGGRLAHWHSWRCEYPERYGECNCNEAVAQDMVREVLMLIADAIEARRKPMPDTNSDLAVAAWAGITTEAQQCAALVRSFGRIKFHEPTTYVPGAIR